MTTSEAPAPSPGAATATRISLRPIATPFPLGFFALATASLLVAGLELGWFPTSDRTIVAMVLVGFAFPLQMLASIFGFLGRDTAAATGFGVQGGTWLVVGLDLLLSPAGSSSAALGVLLLAAAAWILMCALGSALGKLAPASVLGLTSIRFLLTGLYEVTASTALAHAAAIVGLALVAVAAYVAFALVVENLQRRTVLPVLRRGHGAEAMHGDLDTQAGRLDHEAGVREQL
jgi:succinate-acetate transporter protein